MTSSERAEVRQFDIAPLKRQEERSMALIFRVLALVAPLCFAIGWGMDIPAYALWPLTYFALMLVWRFVLRRSADVVGWGGYVLVCVAGILPNISYAAVTLYSMTLPGTGPLVLIVLAVMMGMLVSVSLRVDSVETAMMDRLAIGGLLLAFPVMYFQSTQAFWDSCIIAGATLSTLIMYLYVQRRVARDREQLRQAHTAEVLGKRYEALGQLTGGIAHDFNNILTVILGSTDILRGQLTDQVQHRLLNEVEHATRNGADLTAQLLTFARAQQLSPELTDLTEVLCDEVSLLRRVLSVRHRLDFQMAPDCPMVTADQTGLRAVVMNLVLNARDAMEQGDILLSLRREEVHANELRTNLAHLAPGSYAVISVHDSGHGIAPDDLARVTEPFFSTRPHGTGLGLSMAQRFARQSGGGFDLISKEGMGTRASLWLPETVQREPCDA